MFFLLIVVFSASHTYLPLFFNTCTLLCVVHVLYECFMVFNMVIMNSMKILLLMKFGNVVYIFFFRLYILCNFLDNLLCQLRGLLLFYIIFYCNICSIKIDLWVLILIFSHFLTFFYFYCWLISTEYTACIPSSDLQL